MSPVITIHLDNTVSIFSTITDSFIAKNIAKYEYIEFLIYEVIKEKQKKKTDSSNNFFEIFEQVPSIENMEISDEQFYKWVELFCNLLFE